MAYKRRKKFVYCVQEKQWTYGNVNHILYVQQVLDVICISFDMVFENQLLLWLGTRIIKTSQNSKNPYK